MRNKLAIIGLLFAITVFCFAGDYNDSQAGWRNFRLIQAVKVTWPSANSTPTPYARRLHIPNGTEMIAVQPYTGIKTSFVSSSGNELITANFYTDYTYPRNPNNIQGGDEYVPGRLLVKSVVVSDNGTIPIPHNADYVQFILTPTEYTVTSSVTGSITLANSVGTTANQKLVSSTIPTSLRLGDHDTCVLKNVGSNTVYLSSNASGLTSATGYPLAPNGQIGLSGEVDFYGIADSSSTSVNVLENY